MNDIPELAEGLHTLVVDKAVLHTADVVTLLSVPAGFFLDFIGPPQEHPNGVQITVRVTKALPNGCRPT